MASEDKLEPNPIGIYRRLFPFMRPYLPRLLAGLLCGILHGGSTFGMIIVLRFALGGAKWRAPFVGCL